MEETITNRLSPELARELHLSGENRIRIRRRQMMHGTDLGSQRFCGVRAALLVVNLYPKDEVIHDRPAPEVMETHMNLGLRAIREAGIIPLSDSFVEGYTAATELVTGRTDAKRAAAQAASI